MFSEFEELRREIQERCDATEQRFRDFCLLLSGLGIRLRGQRVQGSGSRNLGLGALG